MKLVTEFTRGILKENPIFKLVLGMCPALAVTTSLENALGMGLAATFVLTCSNVVISLMRSMIPAKVRIPCFIVVIATFVSIVEMLMQAYAPALYDSLGIFIPLIVVNCIILGRAEAYASKNPVVMSIADGLGMGIGFTLGLAVLAAARELLGAGSLTVWGDLKWVAGVESPMTIMILAPGGFIALGGILALMNYVGAIRAKKTGTVAPVLPELDCRHCVICKWGE